MTGFEPVDVVVAVPAHNEAVLLPHCLRSIVAAIAHARATGVADRALVVVAAHRSSDRTADIAQRLLGRCTPDSIVLSDEVSRTIAEVRHTAVEAATSWVAAEDRTWIFNTDADSQVPPEWLTAMLAVTHRESAVAAAGLVDVIDWDPAPRVRHAYDEVVARGIHGARHDHAYGANLAVRADAYRAIGGFASLRHGEDRDLLHRLDAAGHRVATPLVPQVVTSGRTVPRASHGLGALLRGLVEDSRPRECGAQNGEGRATTPTSTMRTVEVGEPGSG